MVFMRSTSVYAVYAKQLAFILAIESNEVIMWETFLRKVIIE